MATRIRRSRPSPDTAAKRELIATLMKSISENQIEANRLAAQIKSDTLELYTAMKSLGETHFETPEALADLYRSAGRATHTIDPAAFRRLVKDDKEFFSVVSVSVTEARKVLPEKKLATIMKTTLAKPGEETVRVVTRGS